MEISITLHTTQNLGDHGREIIKSVGSQADITTVEELVKKLLISHENPNYSDHIEIRVMEKIHF